MQPALGMPDEVYLLGTSVVEDFIDERLNVAGGTADVVHGEGAVALGGEVTHGVFSVVGVGCRAVDEHDGVRVGAGGCAGPVVDGL